MKGQNRTKAIVAVFAAVMAVGIPGGMMQI